MNILGKTIILGSGSSKSKTTIVDEVSTNDPCRIIPTDYTITDFKYSNDVLTIIQNPGNEKQVIITDFEGIRNSLYTLEQDKLSKGLNITLGNGLDGGGVLDSSDIFINLIPGQDHLAIDETGIYIKQFIESTSGGIIPTPPEAWRTSEYTITGDGKWSKLHTFKCITINSELGFPNLGSVNLGNVGIIGDEEITDPKTGIIYHPHTVLIYTTKGWQIIGYSSLVTNWNVVYTKDSIILNDSHGNKITLNQADHDNSGILSANDKFSIDNFLAINEIFTPISVSTGLDINYQTTKFSDLSKENYTLSLPLATDTTNGLLSYNQKIQLNNLPESYSKYTLDHINGELHLVDTHSNSVTGETITDTIKFPSASHSNTEFKNGLLSGEDKLKLDNIESFVTKIETHYDANHLNLSLTHHTPENGEDLKECIELPTVTEERDGLMTHEDKHKLNHLDQFVKSSDFLEEDPDNLAYIHNKPNILTTASVEYSLVPSTLDVKDKQVKVLNANGEWINVSQIPPITISAEEPTDPELTIDGAIWFKTI